VTKRTFCEYEKKNVRISIYNKR